MKVFLSCIVIIIVEIPNVIPTATTTIPTPQPTAVPANVEQISQGLTSVQFQWTAISQNNAFFHIRLYCVSMCADHVTKNFTTMDTSIMVYGLKPDQTYAVQVGVLTNNGVVIEYSKPLQVSTVTSGKQILFSNTRHYYCTCTTDHVSL